MARTFSHQHVLDLAKHATVPVINGLTDYSHPCQAMADLMTLEEHFGHLKGLTMAFVGDGNNVARSLSVACGKFGMKFILSAPGGYELPEDDIDRIMTQVPEMDFETVSDPKDAGARCGCDRHRHLGEHGAGRRKSPAYQGFYRVSSGCGSACCCAG